MTKKKEAVLESKNTFEQVEGSMYNYGGKYSTFAIAEKSGSFLDKKLRHVFVFRIGSSIKEFDVDERTFNKYEENSFGILEYTGNNFVNFEKK